MILKRLGCGKCSTVSFTLRWKDSGHWWATCPKCKTINLVK